MNTDKLKELLAALAIKGPAFSGVSLELLGLAGLGRARAMAELLNALPSLLARLEAAERVVEAGDSAAKTLHNIIEAWVPVEHRGAFRRDVAGLTAALTTYDQSKTDNLIEEKARG